MSANGSDLTCALLRSVGIDPERTTSMTYHHRVGELPQLQVTFLAWNADTSEFDQVTTRFVPTVPE